MLRVGSKVIHISDNLTNPWALWHQGWQAWGSPAPPDNPDGKEKVHWASWVCILAE